LKDLANPTHLIQRLSQLKKEALPQWAAISDVLTKLEQISGADEAGKPWLRRVITELQENANINIGPNQLRKMQRVHKFLSDLMEQGSINNDWSSFPPESFSSLEVISRIYMIDPKTALEKIETLKNKKITYADIIKLYHDIRKINSKKLDSKKETIFLGEIWSNHILSILKQNTNAFFGIGQKINLINRAKRASGQFGASADVIVDLLTQSKEIEIHGFECIIFVSEIEFRNWPRYRIKVAFHSTFFRKYWVMVVTDRKSAENIRKDIVALRLQNTGLTLMQEVDGQPQFEILLAPSGPPVPDRTNLYAASAVTSSF
jgi:hypothetical protein